MQRCRYENQQQQENWREYGAQSIYIHTLVQKHWKTNQKRIGARFGIVILIVLWREENELATLDHRKESSSRIGGSSGHICKSLSLASSHISMSRFVVVCNYFIEKNKTVDNQSFLLIMPQFFCCCVQYVQRIFLQSGGKFMIYTLTHFCWFPTYSMAISCVGRNLVDYIGHIYQQHIDKTVAGITAEILIIHDV